MPAPHKHTLCSVSVVTVLLGLLVAAVEILPTTAENQVEETFETGAVLAGAGTKVDLDKTSGLAAARIRVSTRE